MTEVCKYKLHIISTQVRLKQTKVHVLSQKYFSPPASYFHHVDAATRQWVQNVMLLPAAAQTHVLIFKITVRGKWASIAEVFSALSTCYNAMCTKELVTERTPGLNLRAWQFAVLTMKSWFWLNGAQRLQLALTIQKHLFVIMFHIWRTEMLLMFHNWTTQMNPCCNSWFSHIRYFSCSHKQHFQSFIIKWLHWFFVTHFFLANMYFILR